MEIYRKDASFKEKDIRKLFLLMGDACFEQLYKHGYSDDKVAWMIYRWNMHFTDAFYDADYENISIYTTPTKVDRFFSYRQFIVKTNDLMLFKGTVEVIYVDKKTLRPVRADDFGEDLIKIFDEEDIGDACYDGSDNITDFVIKEAYIDGYKHVNNGVYVEEVSKLCDKRIKDLKIKYQKQCLLGENVKIAYRLHEDGTDFRFFTDSEIKVYANVLY